jgi:hypothetical protein
MEAAMLWIMSVDLGLEPCGKSFQALMIEKASHIQPFAIDTFPSRSSS